MTITSTTRSISVDINGKTYEREVPASMLLGAALLLVSPTEHDDFTRRLTLVVMSLLDREYQARLALGQEAT